MEKKGLNIDDIYFNHLRFADDIVLLSTDGQELNIVLNQLKEQTKRKGIKMNLSKPR